MRILLVTNDFPPRVGGIQNYLWNIYRRLADRGEQVTVFAPAYPGDRAFDNASGVDVERWPSGVYWPTRALERRVRELSRGVDVVAFGAVLPMNLIATGLDRPVVVHTHGFEVSWDRIPVLRGWFRRIGGAADLVTVVSEFTRRPIARAIGKRSRVELLKTGVDLERFHPGIEGTVVRKRHRLDGRPVVTCVSRLVSRKGQDQIIRAFPEVVREAPDAVALIVGGGPQRGHLERLARERGVAERVVFTGEVAEAELPQYYAAGDVFAMPCRSRFGRLEVEGLGLVYLEAQACARPAITGDSGGAPEAVIPGETGYVVPGRDYRAVASALSRLLGAPEDAKAMGERGRRFVETSYRWDDVVSRYRAMLSFG